MTSTMTNPTLTSADTDDDPIRKQSRDKRSPLTRTGFGSICFVAGVAVSMFVISIIYVAWPANAKVEKASDIGAAYPFSVIITVRDDSLPLDTIVDETFPNTLVEGKSEKDVERFKLEWRREVVMRSGLVGGTALKGDKLAIPDPGGASNSVSTEELPKALARE